MSLDRIQREEEAAEKEFLEAMNGTPTEDESNNSEPEATFEDSVVEEDIEDQPVQETIVEDAIGDTTQELTEQPKKPRTSWKKRYTNYKTSTDQKLFQLRRENADLSERVARLTAKQEELLVAIKNTKKPEDTFRGAITPEDEELLGTEAIDVMKRATDAATADLKAELEQLRRDKVDRARREAEVARESSTADLMSRLDNVVEGWQDIDEDPKFGNYLDQVDPLSGLTRKVLFGNSISAGDVEGVARFYRGYADTLPPTRESILERKVAPIGEGAGTTVDETINPRVKTYSISEYENVYESLNKGDYKSQAEKKQLLERAALLDKAFIEGRITG